MATEVAESSLALQNEVAQRLGTTRLWSARRAGWIVALVATGLYLPGIGRAFAYDDAITVKWFVLTPSLLDAVRRQIDYNNHVAFSVLEHVVYSLTGSASEPVMRLLPLVAAVACIGILVAAVARRLGVAVGVLSGVLLATNPLFFDAAREVRGYSLMTLCATASTVLLLDLDARPTRARSIGYVAIVALGLATHLYMVLVVIGHVAYIGTRGQLGVQWRTRWLAALLVGGFAYLGVMGTMIATPQHRVFQPQFPISLLRSLLGGQLVAVLITATGVGVTLWLLRHRQELRVLAVIATGLVIVIWLIAPQNLYPRFFTWLTPGVAVAAAYGLHRIRYSLYLAVAAAVLALSPNLSNYTNDQYANRLTAHSLTTIRHAGEPLCTIGWAAGVTLAVYTDNISIEPVFQKSELTRCHVIVALDPTDRPDLIHTALTTFTHHQRFLDATIPGYVIWKD